MEKYAGMARKEIRERMSQARRAAEFNALFHKLEKQIQQKNWMQAIDQATEFLFDPQMNFIHEVEVAMKGRGIKFEEEKQRSRPGEYVLLYWPVKIGEDKRYLAFTFKPKEEKIYFQVTLLDELPRAEVLSTGDPRVLGEVQITESEATHQAGEDIYEGAYKRIVEKALDRALERVGTA